MFLPLPRLYGGSNDWARAGETIDTHYVSFSLGRDSCDTLIPNPPFQQYLLEGIFSWDGFTYISQMLYHLNYDE